MNLFGGSSTKQRPDSEPRSLGDHGSVFRFLGSQLEGKILRGPMCDDFSSLKMLKNYIEAEK